MQESTNDSSHGDIHDQAQLLGIDMSVFFNAVKAVKLESVSDQAEQRSSIPRGLRFPAAPVLPDKYLREPGYLLKYSSSGILMRTLIDALPADCLDRFHRNCDRLEHMSLDSTFTSMNTGAGIIQDDVVVTQCGPCELSVIQNRQNCH